MSRAIYSSQDELILGASPISRTHVLVWELRLDIEHNFDVFTCQCRVCSEYSSVIVLSCNIYTLCSGIYIVNRKGLFLHTIVNTFFFHDLDLQFKNINLQFIQNLKKINKPAVYLFQSVHIKLTSCLRQQSCC